MNNRFSVNDLIYRANKRRSDSGESNLEAQDYGEILDKLQRIIAKNHSAELAQVLYSEEAEGKLKDLIMRYLNSEHMVAKGIQNISELVDMIYDDISVISGYTIPSRQPRRPSIGFASWRLAIFCRSSSSAMPIFAAKSLISASP